MSDQPYISRPSHVELSTDELMERYFNSSQPIDEEDIGEKQSQEEEAEFVFEGAGTANVPWNQDYCNQLKTLALKYVNSKRPKLTYSFDRARRNILKHDKELHNKRDFKEVPGVGDFIARILEDVLAKKKGITKNNISRSRSLTDERKNGSNHQHVSSLPKTNSLPVTSSSSSNQLKKRTSQTISNGKTMEVKGMKKVKNDEQQHLSDSLTSIDYSLENGQLILILDSREIGANKDRFYFENRLRAMDVPVEVRGLPLGDMVWMYRTEKGSEFLCDTIIERKTVNDLGCSIKDGRYREQKIRLAESGLETLIYLIEGDIQKVDETIPLLALQTSIMETRFNGFLVQTTTSREATCDFLKRIHRSLLAKLEKNVFDLRTRPIWSEFQEKSRTRIPETVGEIFQSMLIQIPGCTADKVRAITELYPTPVSIAQAYDSILNDSNLTQDAKTKCCNKLLEDIVSGRARRRIGPKLSSTIAALFST